MTDHPTLEKFFGKEEVANMVAMGNILAERNNELYGRSPILNALDDCQKLNIIMKDWIERGCPRPKPWHVRAWLRLKIWWKK